MDRQEARIILKELINPSPKVTEKVYPGFQISPEHVSFIRSRILGPQGSHLKHIQSTTNTSVTLRGRGSGFIQITKSDEALHLRIEAPKDSSPENRITEACQLCEDLFNTVKAEYLAKIHSDFMIWQQQQYYQRI